MKKSTLGFFAVTIGLLLLNAGMTFRLLGGPVTAAAPASLLDCRQQQELANKLAAKNLAEAAAGAYSRYLDVCRPQAQEAAFTHMRIGELYMKTHRYEDALAHLYTAEALDKTVGEHTGVKIVEALEKLQRPREARYEMKQRTDVGNAGDVDNDSSPIVARIGEDYIRESDIDALMSSLPRELAPMVSQPEIRDTLINQYVVQEMLYRKALREGADKTPEIRQTLDMMTKQIVVQQMLQDEVMKNVAVTDLDLRTYYEAHKTEFEEPSAMAIDMVELKEGEDATAGRKRLDSSPDKRGVWLEQSFTYIPEAGDAPEVVSQLFAMNTGDISDVQTIEGRRYLFKVAEKKEDSYVPFEDVRETLRARYSSEKQQELTNEFIRNVYEAEDVEIYGFPAKSMEESEPSEGDDVDGEKRA